MSTFIPTYDQTSISILLGTAGFGSITSGSDVLTCGFNTLPSKSVPKVFTPADVGCIITVFNAGPSGTILRATIRAFIAFNQVQLDTTASATVTNDWTNTTIYRDITVLEGSLKLEQGITDFDTAEFVLESLDGSFDWPNEGQPVLIRSLDPAFNSYFYNVLFGGLIRQADISREPDTNALIVLCSCTSWQVLAGRRLISAQTGTRSYLAQTAHDIFTDLIGQMTGEGCGVNSVTGPTITSFTVDNLTVVADALNALVKASNSISTTFQWRVDPWRIFQFYRVGGASAPWGADDADGSDGNISAVTKAIRSLEKVTNTVTADSSNTLNDPITEIARGLTVSSLGAAFSRRAAPLTQVPAIIPTAVLNGVPLTLGESTVDPAQPSTWVVDHGYGVSWKVNITGSSPNYTATLVSGNNFTSGLIGKIIFVELQNTSYSVSSVGGGGTTLALFNLSGGGPITGPIIRPVPEVPAGSTWAWVIGKGMLWTDAYHVGMYITDLMSISYQTAQKLTASYQNGSSVGERANVEGGSGVYESVLKLDQIVSPSEVLGYAQSTANSFGDTAKQVEFSTYRPGLVAGQLFVLHLTEYNAIASYVVTKCSLSVDSGWPKWEVQLALGSIIGDWVTGLIGGLGGGGGTTVAGVTGSGGTSSSSTGSGSGGSSGTVSALMLALDLSGTTLPIGSPAAPINGQDLYVILTNPSGPISWTSDFLYAVADIALDGPTLLHFVGNAGKWLLFDYRTGVV